MSLPTAATEPRSVLSIVIDKLRNTRFGADVQEPSRFLMKPRVLTAMNRNLVLLLEKGLSLPRALSTLADEPSLKKYGWMLHGIRRQLETGASFSTCLAGYPKTFTEIIIAQIEVGEKSGTIVDTLKRISTQFERSGDVR